MSENRKGPSKLKYPGRGGNKFSLAPLTPNQAMQAILKVKLSDVKKLEDAEKASKPGKGK